MSQESQEKVREMREMVNQALEANYAEHYDYAEDLTARSAMLLADFVADEMTHGNLQAAQRMARQHQRLRDDYHTLLKGLSP